MNDKDKSIFESVTDAFKNTIDIATEAAKKALEPDPIKPDEEVVVIPDTIGIGADFMSPMPPMIAVVKKKHRKQSTADTSGRITPAYDFPVPDTPLPILKEPTKKASSRAAKKAAKKAGKKSKAKKAVKKPATNASAKRKTAKKVATKTKATSKRKSQKPRSAVFAKKSKKVKKSERVEIPMTKRQIANTVAKKKKKKSKQ
jgi:hypothetical protein